MIVLILFLIVPLFAHDKYKPYPNFQIPPEYEKIHDYMPASYLDNYPVPDTRKKLNKNEKARLGYLIIVSNQVSEKKYHQTYLLKTNTQIFQLILSNFPDVAKLNWEGKGTENGGVIFLDELAKYFLSVPEVKGVIENK